MLILDHHKTAQADLAGFGNDMSGWTSPFSWGRHMTNVIQDQYEGLADKTQYTMFDMGRSGAQLAWDFFHATASRPVLVDYVADRDLWRFDLLNSREVAAWVFSHTYDFATWDRLTIDLAENWLDAVSQGEAIERKHHKDIAELLNVTRREMVIGGHRVPVANLPYTMASDAAGAMAQEAPFAACYYDKPGARVFSLRSRGDDGMDVSAIAAIYGGGGHRNAAGFQAATGWEGDQ
jgi:oligoribonuclease NrnB/cAMP/cGMP phosphodiesterase (DHH superfamily)